MRSVRISAGVATLACALGLALVVRARATTPQFGDPLPGLTSDEINRFYEGRDAFEEIEKDADGLGPTFNGVSCVACHSAPATGGASAILETRFGLTTNGVFDPMTYAGGSLIQEHGIGRVRRCEYRGEVVPAEANTVANRRTTPLFGLGLVDAVPDATFFAMAANEALDPDGIAGRVHRVANLIAGIPTVGKFGWKAQVPSVLQFSADAYLNEMGVTSPLFPSENCPLGHCAALSCDPVADPEDDGTDVRAFADFMTFLAAPPQLPQTQDAAAGQGLFTATGCAGCHRPTLRTGPNAVAALNQVDFHPYSDFLLHDMGSLGDGIVQGDSKPREMRTAPLWGLRGQIVFLHDGRAQRIEDAILAHDGQGKRARDRFAALSPDQKRKIVAFLKTI